MSPACASPDASVVAIATRAGRAFSLPSRVTTRSASACALSVSPCLAALTAIEAKARMRFSVSGTVLARSSASAVRPSSASASATSRIATSTSRGSLRSRRRSRTASSRPVRTSVRMMSRSAQSWKLAWVTCAAATWASASRQSTDTMPAQASPGDASDAFLRDLPRSTRSRVAGLSRSARRASSVWRSRISSRLRRRCSASRTETIRRNAVSSGAPSPILP